MGSRLEGVHCCDPLQSSEDKERALDQRITLIKQNNQELERRRKDVENDKLLHS